ncbi:hypothetical protein CY35_05G010600, partial [Sphagnum magellanicum]
MAVPAALKAAVDLGVFEILAKARGAGKSLTAKDIASQVLRPDSGGLSVINDRYLERILRLLATENVVRESAVTVASANSSNSTERFYALQPVGTYFVRNDEDAASLAPFLILLQDRDFIEPWHHLSATVLDDSTDAFRRAHGETVLRAYHGFQDGKCLVDVGGGTGSSLALIAAKYPHIRGINYDLPHVVAASPAYPGVEHVAGNMLESVPSGDTIFMKWILYGWDDSECTVALRMDLMMLAFAWLGGRERTLQEFQELAKTAGFASVSVVASIDFLS